MIGGGVFLCIIESVLEAGQSLGVCDAVRALKRELELTLQANVLDLINGSGDIWVLIQRIFFSSKW